MHCSLLFMLLAAGAPRADAPRVSVKLEKGTAADAAAQIGAASGLQVQALGDTAGEVILDLEDVDAEAAVQAVADAVQGSWLRAYVLEKQAPAASPAASQLAQRLREAWRAWFLGRSEAELDGFRQRAQEAAAKAPPPPPQPTLAPGKVIVDPLEMLRGPFHSEQIALQLKDAPLQDAVDQFMLRSGYPVLVEAGLQGTVTLDVNDAKLDTILDAFAEAAQAQWRAFYLIGQPREVSQEEMEQQFAERMAQGAAWLFQQPPERRQQLLQQMTQRIQGLTPEDRDRIRQSPWAPRIMPRVMAFVTTLTPEQRREVSPLLKAFAQLMAP